jgi:phage baseplate assembly protein W|tara:strand:+ start:2044 stop:2451 length:408 start_codon:yes stop_codon:yes gene_type:complete
MARSVREIDKNEDKYVGIRFPLDHSPEGFFYKTKTVLEQSKANLRNLLLTTPGERVFQPNFGSRLKNIVFEQGQDIPNRVDEAIRIATDTFLPYINIINVFTIQEQNQVNIQVEFSAALNPDVIELLSFDFRIGE